MPRSPEEKALRKQTRAIENQTRVMQQGVGRATPVPPRSGEGPLPSEIQEQLALITEQNRAILDQIGLIWQAIKDKP